ncbi:hypothetical protein GF324_04415 [bacterium]|nr:hypothetical protein [bacterium]
MLSSRKPAAGSTAGFSGGQGGSAFPGNLPATLGGIRMVQATARRALLLTLVFAISMTAFADEVFFPRYPGISPDGQTVAFSFQGDIWTVPVTGGEATRITAHPGYDRDPVYSPDGKWMVFASDRHGGYDLFLMEADGSRPKRLTFQAPSDYPLAWSPDSKTIYFQSRRMFDYPVDEQIWEISIDGGTPFRTADLFATEAEYSHDGNLVVFARGDNRFGRRGYRGTMQSELWSMTPGEEPVQLTDHPGYDSEPMLSPDASTIYYRSDQGGVFNLWKMNADGSGNTELTDFPDLGMRNGRISWDGSKVVIEAETGLYVYDTSVKVTTKLDVSVDADLIENLVHTKSYSSGASDLAVSSDGEEMAVVVEGEIVLFNKELGGRATVALPDPAREEGLAFKPGTADTLVFVSDRDGRQSIYLLVSSDDEETNLRKARSHKAIELTKGKKVDCRRPDWSPQGDKIAYIQDKGHLHVMDADGGSDKRVLDHWSLEIGFEWSPDGKWFAINKPDNNYNSDVWIMPSDGKGEMVNVSQHPDEDVSPVWAKEGSMLAWSSRRKANEYDVYYVYLTRELDERTREEWEIWEKTRDKVKKEEKEEDKDGDKEDEEKKDEVEPIEIDFENIHLRIRRASNLAGDEYIVAVHPKGDKLYFSADVKGDRDLYSVNRFGEELTGITSGGASPQSVLYSDDGKTFYYISKGSVKSISADGGSPEGHSFKATITVDTPARRMQVMDEAWRGLARGFYDPAMHGVNWDRLRKQFSGYVQKVSHDNDFADLMMMMLRSLNASHMGYYPNGGRSWASYNEFIGLEYDPTYTGKGLKVSYVLPFGPTDQANNPVKVGDILTHVGGMEVGRDKNVYEAIELAHEEPVWIQFERGGAGMELEVEPIAWYAMRQLKYDEMERGNRDAVEGATDGSVGYVHIQGMSMPEVERFERNLYAAANDKDALIIDVRDNGGGWTTDMLMTILTQPVHAYTVGRDGEIGYPQPRYPLYRWEKPIAVLCNENSYSNAEIFSHAVKTIDRGPVIGTQTGGNVISTWGWSTLDGALVRLPMRGWYVWGDQNEPERNNLNEEHNGAVPTDPVPYGPGDRMNDRDPQLDKAIELMQVKVEEWRARAKPEPPRQNYRSSWPQPK